MILQFGTSRFLQAHAALFAHEARLAGQAVDDIAVVKTTPGAERAERLAGFSDPAGYDVIIRGRRDGNDVDETVRVTSVKQGLHAARDWDRLIDIAAGPLQWVISNTGDSGYAVADGERRPQSLDHVAPGSFPAMLVALLHARWIAGGKGITILPCELVQQNAARLREIALDLAHEQMRQADFIDWLAADCIWANTLVDRIVSEPLDPVGAIAEPYALWAIENQPGLTLPFTHPCMILADDLEPYERLKLHILNLGHTWLAEEWHAAGADPDATVLAAMRDAGTRSRLVGLLEGEVIPGFAARGMESDALTYVATTIERFENPFLRHRIADIHQGHASKVTKRIGAFIEWVRHAGAASVSMPRLEQLVQQYATPDQS